MWEGYGTEIHWGGGTPHIKMCSYVLTYSYLESKTEQSVANAQDYIAKLKRFSTLHVLLTTWSCYHFVSCYHFQNQKLYKRF